MLDYSFKVCLLMIQSREFRNQVLECLVNIYLSFRDPNYVSICQVISSLLLCVYLMFGAFSRVHILL